MCCASDVVRVSEPLCQWKTANLIRKMRCMISGLIVILVIVIVIVGIVILLINHCLGRSRHSHSQCRFCLRNYCLQCGFDLVGIAIVVVSVGVIIVTVGVVVVTVIGAVLVVDVVANVVFVLIILFVDRWVI